jgi:hypothetical protein
MNTIKIVPKSTADLPKAEKLHVRVPMQALF